MNLDLNTIWFILVGVLFIGYAILDGFDLGVGALHLFTKNDEDRRIMMNAIGPVWDGNEVWLLTAGGALFAAFPEVYATAFSGFYLAFMLLLYCLIARAVSMEFRSKQEDPKWRAVWDIAFSVSSILVAILLGVALGNVIWGVPIGEDKEFMGTFLSLLNPYAIVTGLLVLGLFMTHASVYLSMKTDGALLKQVKSWFKMSYWFFNMMLITLTIGTVIYVGDRFVWPALGNPVMLIFFFIVILTDFYMYRLMVQEKFFFAFIASALMILSKLALFGFGMYPNFLYSNPNPENSLTIYNSASTDGTLLTMFIIALVGVPIVLGYTFFIYRVFKGKVEIEPTSY